MIVPTFMGIFVWIDFAQKSNSHHCQLIDMRVSSSGQKLQWQSDASFLKMF